MQAMAARVSDSTVAMAAPIHMDIMEKALMAPMAENAVSPHKTPDNDVVSQRIGLLEQVADEDGN